MSTTFCTFGNAGCYYYRTHLPARGLGAGYVQRDTDKQAGIVYIRRVEDPQDGDVVVYHMPYREWQLEEIRQLKGKGIKVIADVDDSLWGIVETGGHPYHEFFAERLGVHSACLDACDAVTASTEYLRRFLGSHTVRPTFVAENGIDPWRFNIRRIKDDKRFIVGWAGGMAHDDALALIAPQLAAFLAEHDDAILLTVGEEPPDDHPLWAVQPGQRQHVPWSDDMNGYVPWLSRFSVGLAPAVDNSFYRAKSPLRLYEYQASTVPSLCSPATYGDAVIDGVTGLLVPDDGWYDALSRTYSDRKLRYDLGRKGRKQMAETSTINHRLPQWREAIESVL